MNRFRHFRELDIKLEDDSIFDTLPFDSQYLSVPNHNSLAPATTVTKFPSEQRRSTVTGNNCLSSSTTTQHLSMYQQFVGGARRNQSRSLPLEYQLYVSSLQLSDDLFDRPDLQSLHFIGKDFQRQISPDATSSAFSSGACSNYSHEDLNMSPYRETFTHDDGYSNFQSQSTTFDGGDNNLGHGLVCPQDLEKIHEIVAPVDKHKSFVYPQPESDADLDVEMHNNGTGPYVLPSLAVHNDNDSNDSDEHVDIKMERKDSSDSVSDSHPNSPRKRLRNLRLRRARRDSKISPSAPAPSIVVPPVQKRQETSHPLKSPRYYNRGRKGKPSGFFRCSLSVYGCSRAFDTKNEWKRHVSTQHVIFGFYQCNLCDNYANPRKDLFSQHLSRIHKIFNMDAKFSTLKDVRPTGKSKTRRVGSAPSSSTLTPSKKALNIYTSDEMDNLYKICYKKLRDAPLKSCCVVRGCNETFSGLGSYFKRQEHIGKHLENLRASSCSPQSLREDLDLRPWLIDNKIVEWSEDTQSYVIATQVLELDSDLDF